MTCDSPTCCISRSGDHQYHQQISSTLTSARLKKCGCARSCSRTSTCPQMLMLGLPRPCREEVRYIGQEVVAVVAVDEDTAAKQSTWSRWIWKRGRRSSTRSREWSRILRKYPQRQLRYFGDKPCRQIRKGDFDAALAQADYVVEGYYRTAAQEHCPIETQVSVCQTDGMGRTHIWTVPKPSTSTRAHWLTSCRSPNQRCI